MFYYALMVSITEIADMAGVSPATVSRTLTKSAKVSDETLARIEEAMEKSGYSLEIHRKRNNSRVARVKNIAFLILSRDVLQDYSSSFNKTTRAVSSAIIQSHANMIHAYVDKLDNLPPAVANGTIDGLVLSGSCSDDQVMKMISGIPKVWLSSHREGEMVLPLVGNEGIGKMAAGYLSRRGHKKIAFLNAFSEHLAMATRSDFFEFYARKNDVDVELFTKRNREKTYNSIHEIKHALEELIDQWASQPSRATGLFIPLDIQVAICYEILAAKGIKAGIDVDIIGCDNDEAALMGLSPKPATIEIGAAAMGYRAVQELMWRIDNPHAKKHDSVTVVVEPKLVPGGVTDFFVK
ncbi:Maltose operon transcriptional repressor [Limihaloglobus sulfuriphilus]|uniref:Maltose operon transcriptional repressor n=1 Tax=Limihaloglobus sulfuriphilus TaxID=1851148 RepID=A0A1Q2MAY4_9BACT|nr:LacI family DNA-binding transcriptional regulator [Limihaloglobus sulfuriphilus]AQQ69846.1 Maltose operon transcriptional repressor [Limihaloglobus sulfuriphilus]